MGGSGSIRSRWRRRREGGKLIRYGRRNDGTSDELFYLLDAVELSSIKVHINFVRFDVCGKPIEKSVLFINERLDHLVRELRNLAALVVLIVGELLKHELEHPNLKSFDLRIVVFIQLEQI
jgi:hypothetical protein